MGSSSIHQELTGLDCRFSSSIAFVPRTISSFFPDVTKTSDRSLKISMLDEYINRLEAEMRKIDAFKRELPHVMLLINDAIVMMKEELKKFKKSHQEPVLEEFIPLKRINSSDYTEDQEKDEKSDDCKEFDVINSRDKDDKMDWMSSVQLWNSHDNNNDKKRKEADRKSIDHCLPKNRATERASMSFKVAKEDKVEVSGLSLRVPEIKNLMEGIDSDIHSKQDTISSKSNFSRSNYNPGHQQSSRKQRRCWSPDLHQRFINALDLLGGPQVATPKQIREQMKVDGLTNDEVKSHLQKYRLHLQKSKLNGQDESSKGNHSQSRSPEGPLHLNGYLGTNGGDSFEDDQDDDKSESIQLSCRDL